MRTQRAASNAVWASIQFAVSGVILFVQYRYLLRTLGAEKLGIWSIVLATASASRISELGLAGSVTRFVARYLGCGEQVQAAVVVETAVLTIAAVLGVTLLIVYPGLAWIIAYVFPPRALGDAYALLPLALLSLWGSIAASVFQSGLDGCLRTDLRALLIMVTSGLYLFMVFILVPIHGLVGLAWAQIIQAATLLVTGWILLRHVLRTLAPVPCRWRLSLFKEMLKYGVNLQVIGIAQMLFDPTTKVLLVKFGDLSLAGFYDVALKVVIQFRAIVVAATQVLVPVFTIFHETDADQARTLYERSYRLLVSIALPLYGVIIGLSPVISEFMVGSHEQIFVFLLIILAVAWFLNTLIGPAYFGYLGKGQLSWNVWGYICMGVLNAVLGVFLGFLYRGIGVFIASVLALILGSSLIIISYHREHGIPFSELIPRGSLLLLLSTGLGIGGAFEVHYGLVSAYGVWLRMLTSLLIFIICLVPALWYHPLRPSLSHWIRESLHANGNSEAKLQPSRIDSSATDERPAGRLPG